MYGSWAEYAVLWTNSLGFIWDILNELKIYIYWVWAQDRRSNSGGYVYRIGFFKFVK